MKKIMFNDKYGLTQAVLRGIKIQTRRICKEQYWSFSDLVNANKNDSFIFEQPKYCTGEVVAIAQAYREIARTNDGFLDERYEVKEEFVSGWANKMFVCASLMPHQIRIAKVRVERLQDISADDCVKEGVQEVCVNNNLGNSAEHWEFQVPYEDKLGRTKLLRGTTAREVYSVLIDRISGKGTWDSNPYVFVYEFELIK